MKTGKLLQFKALRVILTGLLTVLGLASASAQVSPGDSLALVGFYNATNGPSWSNSANWLTGNVSTWEGVTVENGRVTELYLPFNNVTGSLPYYIGFLQELKFLGLPGNNITGNLPVALVFLQKLEVLNLSDNTFSGSIPATISLNLKLNTLKLARNQFTGSIPGDLCLLRKLTSLDLSENQLTGKIPSNIGSLQKLEELFLSSNQLTGSIPSSFGSLNLTKRIYLNDNKLTGTIPSSIGSIDSLTYFNVANNDLAGSVPSSLTSLTKLYQFNITGNAIVSLPNLSSISSMHQFIVADNKLSFDDIIPNLSTMVPGTYVPQDSLATNITVSVCEGDSLVLSAADLDASAGNSYLWFKTDFSFIGTESTSPLLILPNVTTADAGAYSVQLANPAVSDLLLYRKAITVQVNACTGKTITKGSTKVYPVPFESELNVEVTTPVTQDVKIALTNSYGNVVEQKSGKSNQVITVGGQLGSGVYYMKSQHGSKKDVIRVVKK